MRLLSKVRGLESLLGRLRHREAVGLVWTEDDVRVDRAAVRGDQHVALDVRIKGACGEVPIWETAERISADPEDLGLVYGESGAAVGRVVRVDGSLVEYVVMGRGDSAAG